VSVRERSITQRDDPAPFNPAYFDTVFLVPQAPRDWPRRFAIVTAHNPDGVLSTDTANDEYGRALSRYLRERGIESFAVVGASPDLSHHEAGRGFEVASVDEAAAISSRFRQEAFFWVDDGVVFLCVDASGTGWEMARWSDRLVGKTRGAT
jgi:hypothetical protein